MPIGDKCRYEKCDNIIETETVNGDDRMFCSKPCRCLHSKSRIRNAERYCQCPGCTNQIINRHNSGIYRRYCSKECEAKHIFMRNTNKG